MAAEQLLLQRDVIRRPLHSAVLAWSQHAFVNAATVHGGSPPPRPPTPLYVGREFKAQPEELKSGA